MIETPQRYRQQRRSDLHPIARGITKDPAGIWCSWFDTIEIVKEAKILEEALELISGQVEVCRENHSLMDGRIDADEYNGDALKLAKAIVEASRPDEVYKDPYDYEEGGLI